MNFFSSIFSSFFKLDVSLIKLVILFIAISDSSDFVLRFKYCCTSVIINIIDAKIPTSKVKLSWFIYLKIILKYSISAKVNIATIALLIITTILIKLSNNL